MSRTPFCLSLAALILLAGTALAEEPPAAVPPEARAALERLVGDWALEGQEEGVPFTAQVTQRLIPGGHCLTWDAVWTNPRGTFHGLGVIAWDPAQKKLVERDFWAGAAQNTYTYALAPDRWAGDAVQLAADGAISKGKVIQEHQSPDAFTWKLFDRTGPDGKPREPVEIRFRRLAPATPELLQQYGDVMVGRWATEFVLEGDLPGVGRHGDKLQAEADITWELEKKGLLIRLQYGPLAHHWIVYWDGAAGQVVTTGFDALGSAYRGHVAQEDGKWVIRQERIFPDGARRAAQDTMTIADGNDTHIHEGTRIVLDGVPQPGFRNVWKRVK